LVKVTELFGNVEWFDALYEGWLYISVGVGVVVVLPKEGVFFGYWGGDYILVLGIVAGIE
jgi:hypothetical protein